MIFRFYNNWMIYYFFKYNNNKIEYIYIDYLKVDIIFIIVVIIIKLIYDYMVFKEIKKVNENK